MRTTNKIKIWEPRYHDDVVLIAKYKVREFNQIVFTKAKHLVGKDFFVAGKDVVECPLEDNGKIACYAVPMDKLSSKEVIWQE